MKWSEYFEHYHGWQESTRYSRLASVTDWSDCKSSEVTNCIIYGDELSADAILNEAVCAGVIFTGEEIVKIAEYGTLTDNSPLVKLTCKFKDSMSGEQLDTVITCMYDDPENMNKLLNEIFSGPTHFTEKDVIALLPDMPDDDFINKLAASTDAKFTEDGLNELCNYDVDEKIIKSISIRSGIPYNDPFEKISVPNINAESKAKNPGLFSLLFGVGAELSSDKSKNKKSGKCCGDCRKCPPHYGYRYGRWYYGHGHVEGCEFGGNGNGEHNDID